MSSPSMKGDGFAISRIWSATKLTAARLGQSNIMEQARKLLPFTFEQPLSKYCITYGPSGINLAEPRDSCYLLIENISGQKKAT
jgi:hypothetical protein